MKNILCAIILLFLIIFFTVFINIYAENRFDSFIRTVDSCFSNDTSKDTYEISIRTVRSEYKALRPLVILLVREEDARELEKQITDLESAARSNDTTELIATKNRLNVHIAQLKRLTVFSLEAIL